MVTQLQNWVYLVYILNDIRRFQKVATTPKNKRSVLRRQCSDTNRNGKKVGVLPIRIVKSNVSNVSERNMMFTRSYARNVRLYYLHVSAVLVPTFFYFDLLQKVSAPLK